MKNKSLYWLVLAALSGAPAFADVEVKKFVGSISFSESERNEHAQAIQSIVNTAAKCLDDSQAFHNEFMAKYGISPFYGDQSPFGELSYSGKKSYLRRVHHLNPNLVEQMIPTSCVGFAIRCLKQGFEAAGQNDVWQRVMSFTRKNGVDGTAFQTALRALGWKILYWNPNVDLNAEWDAKEHKKWPTNPKGIWGYHAYRWSTVRKSHIYYNSEVDDYSSMVNFGNAVPEYLKRIPFWVATAHAGYHVFPGTYTRVVESHGSRRLDDDKTIETSFFNPLDPDGGPDGPYLDGIMAIPPGY